MVAFITEAVVGLTPACTWGSVEPFMVTKLCCLSCKNGDKLQEPGVFTLGLSWPHFVPPLSPILLAYKLVTVAFACLGTPVCCTHAPKMFCKHYQFINSGLQVCLWALGACRGPVEKKTPGEDHRFTHRPMISEPRSSPVGSSKVVMPVYLIFSI